MKNEFYLTVPTTIAATLCLVLSSLSSQPANSVEAEGLIPAISGSGFSPGPVARDLNGPVVLSTPTQYNHGNPTVYEQLMLELVNRARANPGAEAARLGITLNQGLPAGTIEDTPKQPLAFQNQLITAARGHSQWMLDEDIFSHTGANGSNPQTRMETAGYVFSGWWTWGENISWGGTTGTPDMEEYTIARHENLFRSTTGHRENICNGVFDEVGLGVIKGKFTQSKTTYNAVMATQNFAKSSATPEPLLLGVVFADADGDKFYDPGEGVQGITVSVDDGDYFAVTSLSGGYALPYPDGSDSIKVTFSGAAPGLPVTYLLNLTGENIKLDLNLTNMRKVAFVANSLGYSETLGFRFTVSGSSGTKFFVQHSTNLVDWLEVQNHTLASVPLWLSHKPLDPSGKHFYRLLWNP